MILVTPGQMQEMDKTTIETFGLPGLVLMENAARGGVEFFLERYGSLPPGTRVGVAAGRGNNGGDGFVMARYLLKYGFEVSVFLFSEKMKVQGDAKANLDLLAPLGLEVVEVPDQGAFETRLEAMKSCGIWIDALLGTGLNSEVRGFYRDIIEFLNESGKPVFAVDMPSGLDSSTGQPLGVCVKADATATFAFAKTGHALHPGRVYCGETRVVDIGIPNHVAEKATPLQRLVDRDFAAGIVPERDPGCHKGETGHILVIAGSPGKTGAAALAGNSAMRAGAGLVTLAAPESVNPTLEPLVVEPMTAPVSCTREGYLSMESFEAIKALSAGKKAIALGPGMGVNEDIKKLVIHLLWEFTAPVVIDADGLNALADDVQLLSRLNCPLVLTPHPGEMARLTGLSTKEIQGDRVRAATGLARQTKGVVLLKGAGTVIATPDGRVFINSTGNPGMASGGMGDTLTGLIAGFLAQGLAPEDAAVLGAYVHGAAADLLAGDYGPFGYNATDAANAAPMVIKGLLEEKTFCRPPDRPPDRPPGLTAPLFDNKGDGC